MLELNEIRNTQSTGTTFKVSPVGILLCIVTAEAEVKVLADVAVYPAAHDESPAVIAGVFHVDHLMVVLVTLRLGTT